MGQVRLARDADGTAADGVDGDIPEASAGHGDLRREGVEGTAVVGVATTVLEAAKVRIAHQADVARLGALNDDDVVFVEVLALVNKFHGVSKNVNLLNNQHDSMCFSPIRGLKPSIMP